MYMRAYRAQKAVLLLNDQYL